MGFLKKLVFGDPEDQGMMYRLRVFDHGHHIKTATVKDRGQDRIDLVVKPKDYFFFGDEIKLAFMINPEIPPHYFGNVAEIDFDVRDSTQLGDLFDLCPDLVSKLNKNYFDTITALKKEEQKKKDDNVIEAEFTEKTEAKGEEKKDLDASLIALTDPAPEKKAPVEPEKTELEKKVEKIPGVKAITHTLDVITSMPHNIRTNIEGATRLIEIDYADDDRKQRMIQKTLEFCSIPENQKCLRWLPKYLHIEPEITAIVSQMELDGIGIMPLYYIKQSTAEISEKMLMRPKSPEDWKTTALMIIGIIAVLGIVIFGLLKLLGKA